MTPEQHAQAIEDALEKYLQEVKDFGYVNHSYLLPKLQAAIRAGVGAAPAAPENIREGAPYDCPAFEAMAREFHVWGRASGALCAQFWLGGMRAAAPKP